MTWHPAPLNSRLTRYAQDGAAVLAWERMPGTARECSLLRFDFRTERDAGAVVERMLCDPFPGGTLLLMARLARVEMVRLA